MPDPDPTPTPAPDPKPAPDPAPEPAKTFTQADVNALLVRQKRAFLTGQDDGAFSVPNEFKQLHEYRKKAEEFDKLEEANKTELEKQTARADKAEADALKATERVKESTLRSAIIAEAAKRQVVDPDAAVALLDRASLELDDTGNPTNISKAMDSLLKSKSYLVGAAKGDADQGARTGGADQLGREALKTMSPEEITKATREGRFNHLLTGA